MATSVETYYRTHRLTVIGTLAVIAAAIFAFFQLRKPTSVVVNTPATGGSGVDAATLTGAYAAGAQAAASGLQVGSDLGQSALGLAGNVVTSEGGVASTLAGTQGQAVSDLASILQQLIGAGQTTVPPVTTPPAPGGAPTPTPTPTPAPAPAPAPAFHTAIATVAGAPVYRGSGTGGALGTGTPTVGYHVAAGTVVSVNQVTAWGTYWWHINGGQYAGYALAFHDPAWSVN